MIMVPAEFAGTYAGEASWIGRSEIRPTRVTRATVARVINGGEAIEYYLNRKQAIFITAKSETAEATDITIEIIEKFDAYEKGAVKPADPGDRRRPMCARISADIGAPPAEISAGRRRGFPPEG